MPLNHRRGLIQRSGTVDVNDGQTMTLCAVFQQSGEPEIASGVHELWSRSPVWMLGEERPLQCTEPVGDHADGDSGRRNRSFGPMKDAGVDLKLDGHAGPSEALCIGHVLVEK